jgi:hypothetical protein
MSSVSISQVGEIGNTYGSLYIKEVEDAEGIKKYYWSLANLNETDLTVEDYSGHEWEPISEQLYHTLRLHNIIAERKLRKDKQT